MLLSDVIVGAVEMRVCTLMNWVDSGPIATAFCAGASGGGSGVLITPRDLVSSVLEDRADDPLPVGARDPVASSVQSQ